MEKVFIGDNMLYVITGCMYAGKSSVLIDMADEQKERFGRTVTYYTPSNRFGGTKISSRDGKFALAELLTEQMIEENLDRYVNCESDVIVIDECQFFSEESLLRSLVSEWLRSGKTVICAGLSKDCWQRPFGIMPYLLCCADKIIQLYARCHSCGSPAMYTIRVKDIPDLIVLASDYYEARCSECLYKR